MRRTAVRWGALLGLLAAALALSPGTAALVGVLGYELAFVFCLPAAVAGLHLGARTVARTRAGSRSDLAQAEARPLRTVFGIWTRATAVTWAALAVPLGVAALNALRVRTCAPATGLAWWVLLPLPSGAVGAATGVVAALVVSPAARRPVARAALLGAGVILASLAWAVWRFWSAPPVFAADPFGGWLAGALYDEDLGVTRAVVGARALHLVASAAALAWAAVLLGARGTARVGDAPLGLTPRAARGRGRVVALALTLTVAAGGLFSRRAALGWALSAGEIADRLGGTLETAHFVLHYDPTGPWARDLGLQALDHELRWAQLARTLGVTPDGKVHSYLFSSTAQKRALMGASTTSIAKPWRREIYLHPSGWPHTVLHHELAHVFGGRVGDPLFGISRRGLWINVGLVEGLAVAAAWEADPLTPDEQVRVLLDAGLPVRLGNVLSPAFFGLNAGQAYAIAGSFCHWFLGRYGAPALEAVFRDGGTAESWAGAAGGASLGRLEEEWLAYLRSDAVHPRPADAARVLDWLKRPPIFRRLCAHDLALRRQRAHEVLGRGETARGLALLGETCRELPDDPALLGELLAAALDAGRAGAEIARGTAERLLHHPKASAGQRAHAELALGDLALAAGDGTTAAARYDAALALPLDETARRTTVVKRLAARAPAGPLRDGLIHYLLPAPSPREAPDAAVTLYALEELRARTPGESLPAYLLGRQLEGRGRGVEAARALEAALAAPTPLPDPAFTDEAYRLLGRARFRAGDLAGARDAFRRLLASPTATTGARLEARDFEERIELLSARPDLRTLLPGDAPPPEAPVR